MILSRERIDAGIDTDVTNKETGPLHKVSYLINSSPAKRTCASFHRPAPSLHLRNVCVLKFIRKWSSWSWKSDDTALRMSAFGPKLTCWAAALTSASGG